MAITEFRPENQNVSQAPTLGEQSGTFGAGVQQRKNIAQGGSGRFTNLQQYVQANEANNPNARLLQREAQTRQGELGTKQQQFVSQATPIKTGLETIRSGQQFVQSALENPTQFVTPERLQQFAGFRTSGVGDIETPFNQFQALRSGLGTQQEQLASGLETIKSTPTALQNFIQSQRANPALATRGENVLDRFLTQSTQSGKQAIEGLGTTANAIRQAQIPTIASEVEALRTQAQGGPLSSADVRNLLTGKIVPEEEFVRGINNLYVAQNVGLGANLEPSRIQYSGDVLQTPALNYMKPENLGTASQSNIDEAKMQYQNYINLKNRFDKLNDNIIRTNEAIKNDSNRSFLDRALDPFDFNRARNDLKNWQEEVNTISQNLSGMDVSKIPIYQEYLNQINKTRQELLSQYDPNRLSRIQALQQLANTTEFTPLLQQRVS